MNSTVKIFIVYFLFLTFSFGSYIETSLAKGPPPPSVKISANPITVNDGEKSILTWVTKRAKTAIIDQGIGNVPSTKGSLGGSPSSTSTYTLSAFGLKGTSIASVTVTVNQSNNIPTAVDDTVSTDEDTPVTVNVITNDTDEDGDVLSIASFTQATNGTVADNGDGTFTYTPLANSNGTDSFTYIIDDGNGGTDSATVSITVNAF